MELTLSIKLLFFGYISCIIAVALHELGHFVAAKLMGFHVVEYSIGSGPIIFYKRYKHIRFVVRLIMINGHVRVHRKEIDDEKAGLWSDFKYIKFAIDAFTGPLVNIVLAIAAFYGAKYFHQPLLVLFAFINAICILNLLPMPGHDGLIIIVCVVKYIERKKKRLIKWISSML